MNTVQVMREGADTTAGLSVRLWARSPILAIMEQPGRGYFFFDDFLGFKAVAAGSESNVGIYNGFADTGGLVADGAALGGEIDFSSDGDNEGASIELSQKSFQISSSKGQFWFEARIKTSTITNTKHGIFVGLIDAAVLSGTVPIAADGAIADENLVGFHRLEGDGDTFDTIYKADGVTAVTVKADATTIEADTYVKLGMGFDGGTKLTFYVDGVPLADTKTIPDATGTDFPADVIMSPVIAVLNATGTTPGNTTMDWWACAQLR